MTIFSLNMYAIAAAAAAAVSQPVSGLAINPVANLTALSLPTSPVNLSTVYHFFVPGTTVRIDFQHFDPPLAPEDTLMCLVLTSCGAYLHAASEPLPEFSFHFHSVDLYIEGSRRPAPGQSYTYRNLVDTLAGIGLYMWVFDRYLPSFLRIYDISDVTKPISLATGEIKWRNSGSDVS